VYNFYPVPNPTNRIVGYSYDAAGNVTGDGTNTYQWDAEGRLLVVLNGQMTAISTNSYNALGQRVRDVTTTSTTDEAYGADGALIWRYTGDSNTRSFVPVEGRILAEYYSGGTIFDHPDELGSLSTSSDYTGNNLNEKLFYPFGEFWTGAAIPNLGMHQTFAQLPDYDPETDQYNTLNRHYSPSGRWMSPDPGGEKVVYTDDPQTWNMYAYVRNNPTTFFDPTGLECQNKSPGDCHPDSAEKANETAQAGTDAQQANQSGANAKARATLTKEAAVNATVGVGKLKIVVAAAATVETGVGALAVTYTCVSASGNLTAAALQTFGAATGLTNESEEAAEGVSTVTSAAGFVTLVATGGNMQKASLAAAAEGIITSNPKDLASGGRLTQGAKVLDLAQDIQAIGRAATNAVADRVMNALSD
jgi:RHS repeat-associated protein